MKKQIIEPDFIGGQGPLTRDEEIALTKYFSAKKNSKSKPSRSSSGKEKSKSKIPA